MKHFKIPMTLLMAAAVGAVASSSASAAVLTSPAGTEYTGEIHMTLDPPDSSLLKAGIEDTCSELTVKGTITTNTATSASSAISALYMAGCTKATSVLKKGSLTISSGGAFSIAGNEWTILDFGVSCVYGGGTGTRIGTLQGGTPAVLNVSTTELPKISGGFLCNSKATWTAKYTVTTPGTLLVD